MLKPLKLLNYIVLQAINSSNVAVINGFVLKDFFKILTEMINSIQCYFNENRARSNMIHANVQHYCFGYSAGESACKL